MGVARVSVRCNYPESGSKPSPTSGWDEPRPTNPNPATSAAMIALRKTARYQAAYGQKGTGRNPEPMDPAAKPAATHGS